MLNVLTAMQLCNYCEITSSEHKNKKSTELRKILRINVKFLDQEIKVYRDYRNCKIQEG